MPTRRTILKAAAATAVGVPLSHVIGRTSAYAAVSRLPLTVVNHTYRYANGQIWVYIVGTNLATGQQSYVRADGSLVAVHQGLNGPDGYADLSVPLAGDGDTHLTIPGGMSGRVYFSIERKIRFRVVIDGAGRPALQYPAGWVPADPSYDVLHDCMEFTLNDQGMFCNVTMVDMLSIPMAIGLIGARDQTTGRLVDGGRDRIFNAISALPDFSRLRLPNGLRVIAPGHGINAGLFPANYFDPYINDVWNRYSGQDMTVRTDARTYRGRVQGGNLVFDNGTAPIRRPTTKDVFFCDGALAAPNDGVTGPLAAMLGAGFNRTTLLDSPDQPIADPGRFYRNPITNHYSRIMHENTVDGKAYGFAFDDVLSFASYIDDLNPGSLTVTLTPFGSGGGQPPPSVSRFEASNYPGRFLRHQNSRGRIDDNVSPAADAQWRLVPGLADGGAVSFESANFPGRYLRHRNAELWLDGAENSALFRADATFHRRPGVAGGGLVSFESYNYPGRYIRHRNSLLFNESLSSDLDRRDATFRQV